VVTSSHYVTMRRHRRWLVGVLALVAACAGDDAPPARPTTTTAVATTTSAAVGAFRSSVEAVSAADLGASWHDGCPVPPAGLRSVTLAHRGLDGEVHQGALVVAAGEVDRIVAVFRRLFEAGYPIERMEPVAAYGGDDDASMAANNTSAFNCRPVKGTDRWSEHAYGRAVDVNPLLNPYVLRDGTVDPPAGAAYADRARTDPGLIHAGDPVVEAFAAQGWAWGGAWAGGQDFQHFSASGR
jgi:hypothetical protein